MTEAACRSISKVTLLVLGALLVLAALPGCRRRGYREIHASTHYHHHLTGTQVHTDAYYR